LCGLLHGVTNSYENVDGRTVTTGKQIVILSDQLLNCSHHTCGLCLINTSVSHDSVDQKISENRHDVTGLLMKRKCVCLHFGLFSAVFFSTG
jgi:hypothetical protein